MMELSSDTQNVETRGKAANANIRDVKIMNESDLMELEYSTYEKEGTPVAVENVALVYFYPILIISQC
jgi:hypothetical protein